MRRLGALLVLCGLVATACGTGDGDLEIGIRRVALNLAFADEELAEPVEPEVIVRLIPPPPEVEQPSDLSRFEVRPDAPPVPVVELVPCPAAPPGSAPRDVVTFEAEAPPAAGSYSRRNTGMINIEGGLFPLALPFPPFSSWDILAAEATETAGPLGLGAGDTVLEWEVRKILSPTFVTTERYRLADDGILLVRREIDNDGEVQVLTPEPPVTFYQFGVEGDEWSSAGVDLETNTAILFEGRIERREVIDVCGELVDTYRVAARENVVNLTTGDTSGSTGDEPDIHNVATQLGGLVVHEEIHSTTRTRDPDTGAPITIEFDYVSTLASIEPEDGG